MLLRDRSGEKIVRFVSRRLGIGEPACRYELRQNVELVQELGVEGSPALVAREREVPIGRRIQRVPADEHGPRLLLRVKAQQEIRETDDRAAAFAAASPYRLGQRVIGAMRERVAVDHEQRPVHDG